MIRWYCVWLSPRTTTGDCGAFTLTAPSRVSSVAIVWLTREGVSPSRSAVRAKCNSSLSVRNALISCSSTDELIT